MHTFVVDVTFIEFGAFVASIYDVTEKFHAAIAVVQ